MGFAQKASRQFLTNDPAIGFFPRTRALCHSVHVTPRMRRKRTLMVAIPAILWVALISYRLVSLQVTDVALWQNYASKQHRMELKRAPERGPILDREGRLLAVSVPAGSVYVRPNLLRDKAAKDNAARALASILEIDKNVVGQKLNTNQPFVWISRQIPRATAEHVAELNLPGVGFMLESKRYHPYGKAASTLLGKVGLDGNGLSGLELTHERILQGSQAKDSVQRDALGNEIERDPSNFDLPRGEPLSLTLDADLQLIIDEELEAGRINAKAKHALGVIIDSDSGEILSMGQAPQADFNSSGSKNVDDLRNLIVETVYEPGSTFKPIVAAAAIEEGVVGPNELINCEHGSFRFGKHNINDVHPYDQISFHDVIVRSSNIGMTKIGMRLGANKLYDYLTAFGFGRSSGIGGRGESAGILRTVNSWAAVDVATHSFGQGIAVNPLQMVRAVAAIANGGLLPELKLLKNQETAQPRRIVSERSARLVRDMMYGVVEDEKGTGTKAHLEGLRVGGKTGTAQKARTDGHGYSPGMYVASFVGFADASDLGVKRNLTAIVIIDEPQGDTIYGGALAAPVFKRIMQRAVHLLATRQALDQGAEIVSPPEFSHDGKIYT